MSTLIIMRGLPGSGKTTLAKKLCSKFIDSGESSEIFSTDDYWRTNNDYGFNSQLLGLAHAWNQARVAKFMQKDCKNIIVDNTNVTLDEMLPYMKLASMFRYKIRIVEPDTYWVKNPVECFNHNVHGLTFEKILAMSERWDYFVVES